MPLVRVDMIKGKTSEYKKTVLNCIHEGLVESIGIEDWDRFQRIVEIPREDFETAPEKTDNFMIIELTLFPGRTKQQKGDAIKAITSRLEKSFAMGWSRHGATQMGKLRAYYKNGGNMLELAEYQKQRLPKAAGSESEIFTVPIKSKATTSETSTELRKYFDVMQAYVPETAKKYAWLKAHEWLW